MCVHMFIWIHIYMNFTSFMKDFCRVSWLETSSEAAKTAEMMKNKGKLQQEVEARIGLSSELLPHS